MKAADGAGSPSTNIPGLTGLTKDVGDTIWKDASCAVKHKICYCTITEVAMH